jgi:ABC-type glycerol-3-phosphate transport system substrate-binding protein
MRPFQIIVLAVFVVAAVGGLVAFSLFKGKNAIPGGPAVLEVWGSFSAPAFSVASADLSADEFKLSYREIPAEQFDQTLIEALAAGSGPDAVILPADLVVRHAGKLVPIPLSSLSERQFKEAFAEAGEAFWSPTGALAVPLVVDPLVTFANRDWLSAAGVARVPRYWDEILSATQRLTVKNRFGQIQVSAVSLGEYRNITNAKDIMAALLFQSGGKIVSLQQDASSGISRYSIALDDLGNAGSALNLYTEFANPAKSLYTWNRSLPASQTMFANGDLALYFGLASEYATLRAKNPHLNLAVAPFPQTRDAKLVVTAGRSWGLAGLKTSRNPGGAVRLAFALADPERMQKLADAAASAPAARALLAKKPASAAGAVFYEAALQARAFLDPNPAETSALFQKVVEDITGGRGQVSSGVGDLRTGLERLLR